MRLTFLKRQGVFVLREALQKITEQPFAIREQFRSPDHPMKSLHRGASRSDHPIPSAFRFAESNPRISRSPCRNCLIWVRLSSDLAMKGKGFCFFLTSARKYCRAPEM